MLCRFYDYADVDGIVQVYARAVKAVAEQERLSVYEIYIARAAEFFGVTKTRDIYEV